jgi:DNA-directed RNA polymerase specialized sigma subunit
MIGADVADLNRRADTMLRSATSDAARESEAREELLRRAIPLVEDIVRGAFATCGFPAEDLFRPGYLGLLNAVYNFDLSHGQPFAVYAENLIKGEVRGYIRERAARAACPLWMNDLNRQVERAQARLLAEKGRLPTLAELADAVNIVEEGIAEIFKAREALCYVSLDAEQRAQDPAPRVDVGKIRSLRPTPFPIEHRVRIASAIERLAGLEQRLGEGLLGAGDDRSGLGPRS